MFGGDHQIPQSTTTCMDADLEFIGEGLLICTPTCRHASSSVISKSQAHVQSIRPILMEQETAPVSVLSARVTGLAPFVPSMSSTANTTQKKMTFSATSDTLGDNQLRVIHDSQGQHVSSRAPPLPCPNSRTVTRTYKPTDISQTPREEANDPQKSCKYVNIPQSSENRTPCRTDIHPAQAGSWPSWSRVVKQEATLLGLDESWPPLLPSTRSSKNTGNVQKPPVNAHRQHEDSLVYSRCPDMENQFGPNTMTLRGHQEVVLDDECWPFLKKVSAESVLHSDDRICRKRRTLQPLDHRNISKTQDQRRRPHGGLFKTQNLHFPPILLMVNKDFIVTSPLKENLLLTLALMGKRPMTDASEDSCMQNHEGTKTKRQVLVGQFKAFSSFMHFMLGHDATRVRMESNAGGTSTISESLSVEYFVRRFQAKDIVTEMEVEYCSFNWKKVDFICTLYGQRVGVSVTRAMSFPDPKDFSTQMAYRLLHKKLFGLVVARHGVSKRHSFSQCILHVWCETQHTASLMQREYDAVSRELDIADDVVMVLTVADGYHARPIFYEYLLRNESK